MSYDSVRQDEQLRMLDPSIGDFIARYNLNTLLLLLAGLNPARQTLFLLPGGMASTLKRADTAWQAAGPASQVFSYDELWITPATLLGGKATDLRMGKTAGEYRDKGNRIIIADGVVSLFGVTPYVGFTTWCTLKLIDWFIFPWDWRRSVDDVGTFFVNRFLPHFQARVQAECNADPLVDHSLIGHSAGGMVVNWILRNTPTTLRKAITVAAPFYGYSGQLHRWFEGEETLNGPGDIFKDGIIKTISSLPGCYSWHFLKKELYDANMVAFQNDPPYSLASYPSVDFATGVAVDPYDPLPPGQRYPTKAQSGFDTDELDKAANLFGHLTSNLSPAQAAKLVNIRGDTTANNTLSTTTWKLVPPTDPSPIADSSIAPGDGTQPGWTTRDIGLAGQVPANVITVAGADVAHAIIMSSPKTIAQVAGVLGIPFP